MKAVGIIAVVAFSIFLFVAWVVNPLILAATHPTYAIRNLAITVAVVVFLALVTGRLRLPNKSSRKSKVEAQIVESMQGKSTKELLQIASENDHDKWSELALSTARKVLKERSNASLADAIAEIKSA